MALLLSIFNLRLAALIRGRKNPPFHRCFPIVPSKWTKWTSKWDDYFLYFSNFFIIFARKKNLMA